MIQGDAIRPEECLCDILKACQHHVQNLTASKFEAYIDGMVVKTAYHPDHLKDLQDVFDLLT